MSQHHFIRRQFFDLKINRENDAYHIQQMLSDYFWKELSPRLEELFNGLVGPGEVVHLDKLEVDLGSITIKELTSPEGLKKILTMLELTISGEIYQPVNTTKITSKNYSTWAQWLYFLEYGTMPWAWSESDEKWTEEVLEAFVVDTSCVEKLSNLLRKSRNALNRLVWQHSETFLSSLISIYTGHTHVTLLELQEQILDFYFRLPKRISTADPNDFGAFNLDRGYFKPISRDLFWRFSITQAIINHNKLTSSQLTDLFLSKSLNHFKPHLANKLSDQDLSMLVKYPVVKRYFTKLMSSTGSAPDDTLPVQPINDSTGPVVTTDSLDDQPADGSNLLEASNSQDALRSLNTLDEIDDLTWGIDQSDEKILETPEEWYIQQAGMVLLHPFLVQFFNKLDLITDKAFKTPSARVKAIHLLCYMSSGIVQPGEHLLALPKLICGVPLGEPVPKQIVLSEPELEEADRLLEVVIGHWEILGKTSIEGLRESFLMRDGKLSEKPHGWQMLVEQKSIDVLLDQLPWNLGIVKLPWMSKALLVDWR